MWYVVLVRGPDQSPRVLFRRCHAAIFGSLTEALRSCADFYEEEGRLVDEGLLPACQMEVAVTTDQSLWGVELDRDPAFASDINVAWTTAIPGRRAP